ncbi:MAG: amino acid ABC transporter substrate-binding protein [Pseudomonadota bacterium]
MDRRGDRRTHRKGGPGKPGPGGRASCAGILAGLRAAQRLKSLAAALALLAAAPLPAAAQTAAADDAIERIARRSAIVMGFRSDAPPFSYMAESGAPLGLAVRLCASVAPEISRQAGAAGALPVIWVPVTSTTRFEALAERRIDVLCGPTTQTLTRRETLDFSIPYFVESAGIVFRKGGPERLQDLTDEPVGVLDGTTTEAVARRVLAELAPQAQLRLFDSHVEGLDAMQQGLIEAYMGDQSIVIYQLGRLRPSVMPVISRRKFSREPYALTVARGESGLRLALDRGLSRLYQSGEIYDLIRESLGRVNLDPETEAIYDVVAIPE